MGYIFMIVVGAAAGWLAAIVQRAVDSRALLVNLGAGIVGALVAGLLLSPVLVGGSLGAGTYTVDELLVALGGSITAVVSASMLRDMQIF
ncbi:GlsB/YeaQ/YmgE family stress response membrane protein [Aurantiacibacter gilvus]|uniref:GlsB/YeaQ/YmgE family stress response membrane protein n=1 Tax=Aurantiacibacter gilvus TaxID=3139141 RepID=A0ABU9IHS8_9SPHN